MKFPRNARIFRGQLDAAPLASVLFLLVMFVLLGSLVYTPGVRVELQLPTADGLPGTDGPTVSVAIDRAGQLYFQNQMVEAAGLRGRLEDEVKKSPEPLTLVVQMDKGATEEHLIGLTMLASKAGIQKFALATLPPLFPPAGATIVP
jgi:biopolymer transport protein ExbD